ncbi:hypothetical protein Ddc_16091 [Ditylenchus destructor]|nr:hypothetical protein Ddc_16091 [Ditylenchus destructor]
MALFIKQNKKIKSVVGPPRASQGKGTGSRRAPNGGVPFKNRLSCCWAVAAEDLIAAAAVLSERAAAIGPMQ